MNLPENFQEIITNNVPEQESSPEMQWVEEVENLVGLIKGNIHFRDQKSKQLENVQPEIDELLAKLAEKQAEEERIKAEIKTAEEEYFQYKEHLFEASSR